MKQWDVCLMNPPYDGTLYLKFTDKCLDLCNLLVSVMPSKIAFSPDAQNLDSYKTKFDKSLISVDENERSIFDADLYETGIFVFDNTKSKNEIILKTINNNIKTISSLFDVTNITPYEYNISTYLHNKTPNFYKFAPTTRDDKKNIVDFTNKKLNNIHKDYILISAESNGSRNGKFFSSLTGQIFKKNDILLKKYLINKNDTGQPARCILMQFDNKIMAENCKKAMNNPILRMFLLKTQTTQSLTTLCYQYVPNIDWSDPRVVTDEGLLEVCGCPKDKCKEYAEYCRKYMEEFDKQHESKKKKKK